SACVGGLNYFRIRSDALLSLRAVRTHNVSEPSSPGSRLWLRPGGSTQALRIPSRDGHPTLSVYSDTKPSRYARPLVDASPLRGCGGTFTRKRNALLGAGEISLLPDEGVQRGEGRRAGGEG